jgi:chitodextrinase
MFVRTAARAALVLALMLVFADVALAAPPRPSNLRITNVTAKSLTLAWDASKTNSSNWWFCVRRSGQGCFRVDPPKTTFVYPLQLPNTTFVFDVIAIDARGNRSAPSNSVTHTTPPDTAPPSPPPVVSATNVKPTRISVSWTASTDDWSQVYHSLFVNGVQQSSGLIGVRGYTVLYLSPQTTYTFEVTARDAAGNTARSNVLSVTTPAATDTVAPSAPTNLQFSSETSPPEIWLDWTAATDNSDPPGDLLYEVFVNGVHASTGIGNDEDIVYCQATGLNTIKVRAVDTSGNASAFSNEISLVC